MLGLDAGLSPRLQRKACRLAADVSFAVTGEHLKELLGVSPSVETLRVYRERQAGRVMRWQGQETASAEGFARAEGAWEFAVDAGAVVRQVAEQNPDAAEALRFEWLESVEILARFPSIGPAYERDRTGRAREITCRRYRIFYRVSEPQHRVEILTVWHGSRREPKLPK